MELADEPKKAPEYIQTPKLHTIIGEGGKRVRLLAGPKKTNKAPHRKTLHFRNLARSSLPQVRVPQAII